MTELEEVRDGEEQNYRISIEVLGDSVTLTQDLIDLYRLLVEISTKSEIAARDEIVAALQFLLASQYQLTVGVLAALRGHLTDSFRHSRMAIEQAGFAARVKEHPHLALVWMNAGQDETSYAKYREKFSTGKLFPDGHAVLEELGRRYDYASKLGHPSIYAMATQSRIKSDEDSLWTFTISR